MSTVNFLHISDLHFQHDNEEQHEFIVRFLHDIEVNSLKNICKFVVFSGDLVMLPSEKNYASVKSCFIEPLMNILQLPLDHFFLVPGNHDIDIEEIEIENENSDWFVPAISEYFQVNRNRTNDSIKKAQKHLHHKFDKFLSFHNSLYQDYVGTNVIHFINEFNSVHIYTYSNNKIGIACINSALTCFGSSTAEVGKIHIVKEQIEALYRKIKDCHIRIAVFHHPLDGTHVFSLDQVKSYLIENFHVLLLGHTHAERSYFLAQNNKAVYYNISSCLFSDDYNKETIYDPSYSFVHIDCEDLNGTAFFRKYYAMRKEFDVDLRMFPFGKNSFSVQKENENLSVASEKSFTNLHKPTLIQNSINVFQNLDEEKSGYDIQFRGKTFCDQYQRGIDFSMFSLRGTCFRGCTFDSCLFTNTILIDSSFEDCHFTDVKFISIDHYYAVEYSDVNGLIAVAGEGGVVVILRLVNLTENSDKLAFTTESFLYGVESKIRSLSWRYDGCYIAAADQMGYMYIWEIGNPNPVYKQQVGNNAVYAVKWSPTGNHLTSTDESGYKLYVYQFSVVSENKISVTNIITLYDAGHNDRHYQQILDCAWSNDARWIATVGIDRNICIWDMSNIDDTTCCPPLKYSKSSIHSDYIRKIIWNNDSNEFITCGDDGVVKIWILGSGAIEPKKEICVKPREGNNEVLSLVWYSDEFVIAGLRDDDCAIIKIEYEPVVEKSQKAHKGRIWDMSVDKQHDIIFTVGNGTITAWSFNQSDNRLVLLCSYESKLLCTGMKFIKCDGLDNGTYLVAKNKDIPEKFERGSLKDFLLTKGATIYPTKD